MAVGRCLDGRLGQRIVARRLGVAEQRAVAAHLEGCAACRALIGKIQADAFARTEDGARAAAVAPRRKVGRFHIVRLVGEGAMGVVYEAYDPRLERRVALKLLRHEGLDAEVLGRRRGRFVREARAVAKLAHPNVVTIHEVSEEPTLFLAMELVDGVTLGAWLKERSRSWRDIVRVYADAARGLAAAHAAGIVHRDFKPDNVLVDRTGRARVADFGLAVDPRVESHEGAPGPSISLTASGTILGTPRYMSPEQCRGEPVDARADQFSFCVSLYEALFRRHPFDGDTAEGHQNPFMD